MAIGGLLGFLSATLSAAAEPASSAQTGDEAASLAEEYIQDFVRWKELEAEENFLKAEIRRLRISGDADFLANLEKLKKFDKDVLRGLGRVLQESLRPLVKQLTGKKGAVARLKTQVGKVRKTWQSVRAALNHGQVLEYEIKANQQIAAQVGSLLSVDKGWFWLFGLVAIGTLVGLVAIERRRELRRMFKGGKSERLSKLLFAALAVLLLLTVTTFLLGEQIYGWVKARSSGEEQSPRARMEKWNEDLREKVEKQEDLNNALKTDKGYEAARAKRNRVLADALPEETNVPALLHDFRGGIRQIEENLLLLAKLSAAMQADLDELTDVNERLKDSREKYIDYLRFRQWIQGCLGVILLGLTAAGGCFFWYGVRRRRKTIADTCPLCGKRGKLVRVSFPEGGGDNDDVLGMVRCTSTLDEQFNEMCSYEFINTYRNYRRLCFPTLGIPEAGKTVWLAMTYRQVSQGNYPRNIDFQRIKSPQSEQLDQMVEGIIRERVNPSATQRERIPIPLVFNFRDRDWLGKSNVLVNVFDFSGEVTADMQVTDYRRRRALNADGFFFFLDPTRESEAQAKALADFREDLQLVKRVPAGTPVRAPVALCISKIDELPSRFKMTIDGADPMQRFFDELKRIDPAGGTMTAEVLEARSRLTAKLHRSIWPGWQIERQIRSLFGGRYKFFPLTSFGLDGRGKKGLDEATLAPFGLLEPLIWLLEMNGHPTLD